MRTTPAPSVVWWQVISAPPSECAGANVCPMTPATWKTKGFMEAENIFLKAKKRYCIGKM